jgi:hypothetical protein
MSRVTSPQDLTQLLINWRNGDKAALDQMTPALYEELRRLARFFLANERPDHTLQPTALVHEAYIRLISQHAVNWRNRAAAAVVAGLLRRMGDLPTARQKMQRAIALWKELAERPGLAWSNTGNLADTHSEFAEVYIDMKATPAPSPNMSRPSSCILPCETAQFFPRLSTEKSMR